jgi:inosine-uridine nucleoside N-ribohydrolase
MTLYLIIFDIHHSQGHDDATAILLALHCPDIHLLGISTVRSRLNGVNATLKYTYSRCMAMPMSLARRIMLLGVC